MSSEHLFVSLYIGTAEIADINAPLHCIQWQAAHSQLSEFEASSGGRSQMLTKAESDVSLILQ